MQLSKVVEFEHQVTGVTVTPSGRRFVSFPRWTEDTPISVAEVGSDGELKPYPDERWNEWRNARAAELAVADHFVCVQAVVADRHHSLWVLDPGAPGSERTLPGAPKLVRIDLRHDAVGQIILFDDSVALQGSYLSDLCVSADGKIGYITDSGTRGALVVVDLDRGTAFRALDGHPSTQAERNVVIMIDGEPLRRPDGRVPTGAADGIALSTDDATVYWQSMTGRTLYCLPTLDLRPSATGLPWEDEVASVKAVMSTHVADGLWMSGDGVLYLTSPTHNAITAFDGECLVTVVEDDALRWPDTIAEAPDGSLYVTASHRQDMPWFRPNAPCRVPTALYRFKTA